MRGRTVRIGRTLAAGAGVAGLVAGLLAGAAPPAGAAPHPGMTVAPMPVSAVPLAQAGAVMMWGDNDYQQLTVPPALHGVAVTQVALGASGAVLALTADGRVVGWGASGYGLQKVPAAVSSVDVAQIAIGESYAGAVTRDGRVLTWGTKSNTSLTPLDVPAGLSGVTQLAIAGNNAIARKSDGSVVAWGKDGTGVNTVPVGLNAQALTAAAGMAYALTSAGTVLAWGNSVPDMADLPAAVKLPGNVTSVGTCSGAIGVALLADHSLVMWDNHGTPLPDTRIPVNLLGVDAVSLAVQGDAVMVVDTDGKLHAGQCGTQVAWETPAALDGKALAHVGTGMSDSGGPNGAVVITAMLRGALPVVTGTAKAGSVLTATGGTFSGSPDAIAHQWLIDGAPVAGATGPTLTVAAAMEGKKISYRSTATKAGENAVVADSVAVTVAPDRPAKAKSTTELAKVKVAKKAAKVTVSGKVTSTASVTGKAVVTIVKGKKTIISKSVSVPASGKVTLTVKKFGKLAIKKTKSKSKTGYRGGYTVTVKYAGNAQVLPSADKVKFKVT